MENVKNNWMFKLIYFLVNVSLFLYRHSLSLGDQVLTFRQNDQYEISQQYCKFCMCSIFLHTLFGCFISIIDHISD